jgi:hypothetical protein
MQFSAARPDIIRAINQRWLLQFWQRQLGGQRLPRWQSVDTESLKSVSANLSLLDVMDGGGTARLLIRFHGSTIAQAYGAADCRGKCLNDMLTSSCRSQALAAYQQAVDTGNPVYTILDISDRQGRPVEYERLLLPFAGDGRTVDRILASFEFISPDGAFEINGLLLHQPKPPALRLAATFALEPSA